LIPNVWVDIDAQPPYTAGKGDQVNHTYILSTPLNTRDTDLIEPCVALCAKYTRYPTNFLTSQINISSWASDYTATSKPQLNEKS
jgi:hypothetical protein